MAMDEAVKRRGRASRLLPGGMAPPHVAQRAGAPRQTVYRWLGVLNAGGIEVLRQMSQGGRPSQLDEAQHPALREILLAGAPAAGLGTDL